MHRGMSRSQGGKWSAGGSTRSTGTVADPSSGPPRLRRPDHPHAKYPMGPQVFRLGPDPINHEVCVPTAVFLGPARRLHGRRAGRERDRRS